MRTIARAERERRVEMATERVVELAPQMKAELDFYVKEMQSVADKCRFDSSIRVWAGLKRTLDELVEDSRSLKGKHLPTRHAAEDVEREALSLLGEIFIDNCNCRNIDQESA